MSKFRMSDRTIYQTGTIVIIISAFVGVTLAIAVNRFGLNWLWLIPPLVTLVVGFAIQLYGLGGSSV